MKALLILISLFSTISSLAEYRVYQYNVKSKLTLKQDSKPYLVTSTLDPVSYLSYHGGASSISVDLLRTWRCKGHTGTSPICSAPLENSGELQDI